MHDIGGILFCRPEYDLIEAQYMYLILIMKTKSIIILIVILFSITLAGLYFYFRPTESKCEKGTRILSQLHKEEIEKGIFAIEPCREQVHSLKD